MLPMEDVEWYVPSYMFKIPSSGDELAALLDRVKRNTGSSEFIIAATATNAATVLTMAHAKNMISNILHWFVVTRDLAPFYCLSCGTYKVIHVAHIVNNTLMEPLASAIGPAWNNLSYWRVSRSQNLFYCNIGY